MTKYSEFLILFDSFTPGEKNELLPLLGKATPNLMNSSDYHVVCTTTYLSNVIAGYNSPVEGTNEDLANHMLNYIQEWDWGI